MKLRWSLAQAINVCGGQAVGTINMVYMMIPKPMWKTIKDRHDPRVAGREMNCFLGRAFAFSIVDQVTIWKRMGTYAKVKAFLKSEKAEKAVPVV